LHGPTSAAAAAATAPLIDLLLRSGKTVDAIALAQGAYATLRALGDPLIVPLIPVRAEALKAVGRLENPFSDLGEMPENLIAETVAEVISRSGTGDPVCIRAVLSDLLAFADSKFGDAHPLTLDILATLVHHETRFGADADIALRRSAIRRSVWSYAMLRAPSGLLSNLEIDFEADGGLHLVPHVGREPNPTEVAQIQRILTAAVDDLYSRPLAHV
jgi:hypothetical protein